MQKFRDFYNKKRANEIYMLADSILTPQGYDLNEFFEVVLNEKRFEEVWSPDPRKWFGSGHAGAKAVGVAKKQYGIDTRQIEELKKAYYLWQQAGAPEDDEWLPLVRIDHEWNIARRDNPDLTLDEFLLEKYPQGIPPDYQNISHLAKAKFHLARSPLSQTQTATPRYTARSKPQSISGFAPTAEAVYEKIGKLECQHLDNLEYLLRRMET